MDQSETHPGTKKRLVLPWTFSGVAAFSRVRLGQCLFHYTAWAVACALLWAWSIHRAWVPGVELALSKFPEKVSIRAGHLVWPTSHPVVLSNDRFLSIIVNPGDESSVDRTADIQFELGGSELRCRSFLGWIECPYPAFWSLDFGRDTALPWWGAWKPSLMTSVALVLGLALFTSWVVVAVVYTGPGLVIARILGKPAEFSQIWRVTVAALLPGAAFLTTAVVFYSFNRITLLLLSVFWLGHWVVGWIYLVGGIMCLPKSPPATAADSSPNPFGEGKNSHSRESRKNPFQNQ